ncbi:MAG: hypothetical protein KIT84_37105 [Labilithrix sp.]|nr:hypothetical protein [Labilithrix sp.]MCW5816677.1 hypothetical protein [Labilithrix sp.]
MRFSVPVLAALAALACGPPSDANAPDESGVRTTGRNRTAVAAPESTKVSAFSVDPENLLVDRIAMRDGGIRPDGNRDLVFRATVEGPADALYLVTTSQKGDPQYGFRADTISGHEELPSELGSVVDVGRLTVWIAVVENGKFINVEGGALGYLAPGAHALKLYVPNPGNLAPGAFLRLYARAPNGGLVAGPVITY